MANNIHIIAVNEVLIFIQLMLTSWAIVYPINMNWILMVLSVKLKKRSFYEI